MEREVPTCKTGTPATEASVPKAFQELSLRMVEQQMRSQLVVPAAVALVEESVTRYWRPRVVNPMSMAAEVVMEGRTVFRRTYQMEREAGSAPMFVLVTARKDHDDQPVNQLRDLSVAQCYLWDGAKWKFLFEWDHLRDDWTFEQSPLAVVDPLDDDSPNFNPEVPVL